MYFFFGETLFSPQSNVCVGQKMLVVTDIWRLLIRLKWWEISPPKHSVVITQQLT